MQKRVIIIHGWADDPSKGWIGWLVRELQKEGIEAHAPHFPNVPLLQTDFDLWQRKIDEVVGELKEDDVLVAHSMGVPMLFRYLSDYPGGSRIAGLVTVAGVADFPLFRPNPLFDPPLDFEKITQMAKTRIAIYSDNDKSVPEKFAKELIKKLKARPVLDKGKGHFQGMHGCAELPSVLGAARSCFQPPAEA